MTQRKTHEYNVVLSHLTRISPHRSVWPALITPGQWAQILDAVTHWQLPSSLRKVQTLSQAIACSEWFLVTPAQTPIWMARLWKEVDRGQSVGRMEEFRSLPIPIAERWVCDLFLLLRNLSSSLRDEADSQIP